MGKHTDDLGGTLQSLAKWMAVAQHHVFGGRLNLKLTVLNSITIAGVNYNNDSLESNKIRAYCFPL